jgi:hypothetical protein
MVEWSDGHWADVEKARERRTGQQRVEDGPPRAEHRVDAVDRGVGTVEDDAHDLEAN